MNPDIFWSDLFLLFTYHDSALTCKSLICIDERFLVILLKLESFCATQALRLLNKPWYMLCIKYDYNEWKQHVKIYYIYIYMITLLN